MIVQGYSLELYCDEVSEDHEFNEFPHRYTGEKGSTCRRSAREDGWILHRDRHATCPKCSGKTPKEREHDIQYEGVAVTNLKERFKED